MTKEASSIKLEKEIMDKAREQAKKENRSLNNFIETILIKYFKEKEEKK
jgi:hypothetical protein